MDLQKTLKDFETQCEQDIKVEKNRAVEQIQYLVEIVTKQDNELEIERVSQEMFVNKFLEVESKKMALEIRLTEV